MKTIKRRGRSQRRGSVLLLVSLALVVFLTIGTGLLGLGLQGRLQGVRAGNEIAARCAADAGLTKALFEMNERLKATAWDDSVLPEARDERLPNCDATFSYTVTGDLGSGYVIECTGRPGKVERSISSTLSLRGLFEYAVFGEQGVELGSGAAMNWYNYGEEANLKVGTDSIASGAIDLKSGARVNGDVVVGVGGEPGVVIHGPWATITGESYAATEKHKLPAIELPWWLESLASGGTIKDNTTITGSAKYDEINLKKGKIITIEGPVILYIVGDVILKNSAELQVVDEDDCCLTLYLGGGIEVKNSGAINNLTKAPGKLKIYGLDSCRSIILKNGSDFYGAIYARNADVEMKNSAEAFGAVVSNSFEQKNSATFNYDASLRDVSVDDEGARFAVKRWGE